MFGWQEWILIAIVVLIIFGGAKKLPELARSLGKSLREFKKAIKEVKNEVDIDETDILSETDNDKNNSSDTIPSPNSEKSES